MVCNLEHETNLEVGNSLPIADAMKQLLTLIGFTTTVNENDETEYKYLGQPNRTVQKLISSTIAKHMAALEQD